MHSLTGEFFEAKSCARFSPCVSAGEIEQYPSAARVYSVIPHPRLMITDASIKDSILLFFGVEKVFFN